MKHLVFELGTEAIPADYMPPALAALEKMAQDDLKSHRISFDSVRVVGTPQRLVLEVHGLAERQEDVSRIVQGPRVDIAFKDGEPTGAATGFARKNGVEVSDLEKVTTDRGEFVQATVHEVGKLSAEVLPGLLADIVGRLPWPKTMRWNEEGYLFPRPIRWILALLDDTVLPVEIASVASGSKTKGHRLVAPGFHEVKDSQSYEAVLKEAGVNLRPEDRAAAIEEQLATVAKEVQGQVLHDPELLEEVTFLVEMPQAFAGSFDPEFLAVPREVTVTAMRSHQRYFAVEDASGKLLPHFLVVADGRWEDPSQVIAGNERVLRARLSDARFYWDVDLKTGLDGLADALKSVVWLEGLGTLADKSERVAKIMAALGPDVAGAAWSSLTDKAPRAAKVAKADLASEMIKDGKEFTGLQGVIGARYGEALGEDPEVCQALAQQYLPRGSKDPLPESELGLLLALADRFDTIAGCWAAGFVPTGSQDPYGLRRAGNGIVRILLEKSRVTSLSEAIKNALQNLPGEWNREALGQEIAGFFRERLAFHLRERSISYDVVDAVLEVGADHPVDALARAKALQAVRGEAELERLVIGYKRAANILKGINASDIESFDGLDWSGAEPAEEALRQAVTQATPKVLQLNQDAKYPEMLQELLTLREPIDAFFDDVMVMSEDPKQKTRRVSLLNQVRLLFQNLCDLSCIVIEGE